MKLTKKRPLDACGRERESEQAALAAGEDGRPQIEKVGGQDRAVPHDADAPGLFDDELHAAIERILDERDGRREARRVDLRAQPALRPNRHDAQNHARGERQRVEKHAHAGVIGSIVDEAFAGRGAGRRLSGYH